MGRLDPVKINRSERSVALVDGISLPTLGSSTRSKSLRIPGIKQSTPELSGLPSGGPPECLASGNGVLGSFREVRYVGEPCKSPGEEGL